MVRYGHFIAWSMLLSVPLTASAQVTNNPEVLRTETLGQGLQVPDSIPVPVTNNPVALKKATMGWGDSMHDSVSRGILSSVHRFDSFFGEDIVDDDQYDTFVRVSTGVTLGEGNRHTLNNTISARLRFPQLQNRIQIIFDDVIERNAQKDVLHEVTDSEPLTGIRYIVADRNRLRFNLDVGVKLRMNADAFIRARVSRVFVMDPWSLKLSEDVFWLMRDGFGEDAQARFSRKVSKSMIFKASTHAKWDESHDGITYSQTFALYKELSRRRATRWVVGAEMPTSPNTKVSDYFAEVTWRQLIHMNWLYLEITPTADFPAERNYTFTPVINFTLEFMFGDVPHGFWQ